MTNAFHKADVQVGAVYSAKVSGRITCVRIDRAARKGWYATNLKTCREVRVLSAAKLRSLVASADDAATLALTSSNPVVRLALSKRRF